MKGKILVSAVSLILVVGVALGVVIAVHKNNGGDDTQVRAQKKAVMTVCQSTSDQKLCHDVLSSARNAGSTDPKEYLATIVKTTTEYVIKSFNLTDRLSVSHGSSDNGIKMALDDCKRMLEHAMDSLDFSTTLLRDNNIQAVHFQTPDLRNWLGAVISYQQACMEGFDESKDAEKKLKEELNIQGLDKTKNITAIGLDIIADLSKILEQFNLKIDLKPASRRLLGHVEVDDEGTPTWFSHADRKLLKAGWRTRVNKPNVVVAKDGSGQFKTIKEAINSYPKGHKGRYIIYVKAGVYDEYLLNPKTNENVIIYGDGPTRTIVTGRKSFRDGVKTMDTATFANEAKGFIARSMRFENTAGPEGHQAVAFRNQGDASAIVGCHIFGYQDSLYAQSNRQFYRNCEISGTVDFIFGMSSALFQNSKIIVRKPGPKQFNTVTADGTEVRNVGTGIVIQNCQIVPEAALFPVRFQVKSFLGRPWKQCSTTVVMESTLGDFINPEGWAPWAGSQFLDTLYYAEYANTGPGANVQRRIRWKGYRGVISKAEAYRFTAGEFLKAGHDSNMSWLRKQHVPNYLEFARP
ncbi:hypothetical protein RIF29_24736 [Crotalaria pallida]|uniref:Pectinesterase n=1 Tax=Crotalaria pallida TaxID=3830 RepID=A0AAN9EKW5_CROPI